MAANKFVNKPSLMVDAFKDPSVPPSYQNGPDDQMFENRKSGTGLGCGHHHHHHHRRSCHIRNFRSSGRWTYAISKSPVSFGYGHIVLWFMTAMMITATSPRNTPQTHAAIRGGGGPKRNFKIARTTPPSLVFEHFCISITPTVRSAVG